MSNLIEVKGLYKEFPIKKGFFNKKVGAVHAVNNVSFDIAKGETLGLVGESGCGKSTAGRCILGLIDATSGSVKFDGSEIINADKKVLKNLRHRIQIIFQNPYSSLNPRMNVNEILMEPFVINKKYPKKQANEKISELLDLVGIPKSSLSKFPHEFSGGQRQRIVIARALTLEPEFIVADEPVSALDVSIQAQIINLMEDLKKELGLTYLFISHDLSIVRYVSDRVAVMYLGEIVEMAPVDKLYENPKHPYTKALLNSVPVADPDSDKSKKILLAGDLPSPSNPPQGCKFHTRCQFAMDVCRNTHPESLEIDSNHYARCHLIESKAFSY